MKYSLQCPSCTYVIETNAANDPEATEKLILLLQAHQTQSHPEAMAAPENTLRAIVMTYMRKEGLF